jgi:cold shock CspA family protein
MMTNLRRWPVLAAALAVAVFLSAGCSGKSDKKEDDKKGEEKKGEEKKGVGDAKPDFTLTAKAFDEEYNKDKKAAEAKYKGKVVELSGTVKLVGRNLGKEAFVSLDAGSKNITGVMCFTTDKQPWLKATPGRTAKLKGKWPEFTVGPSLVGCIVTEVSGPETPTLTADELGKAYAADKDATTKKYDNKYLFLTGEIAKVTFNEAKAASVLFKTSGKTKVLATFTAFDKEETEKLKAGQKIKVLGLYSFNFAPDEVSLNLCIPVEEGK